MDITLTVTRCGTMVNIESDDIAYGTIKGMYQASETNPEGYGEGLQVNDESKRPTITEMCRKIAEALFEYEE